MWSVGPSLLILGLVAIAAARLTQSRSSAAGAAKERIDASIVLAIATAVQAGHFLEEWATGFHVLFPRLLGLDPMPLSFFVSFNVAWIAAWGVSVPFLRDGRKLAFFAAWFLALAGMLNGVAHPILAIVSGGYFPGLATSPMIGLAAIFLWRHLRRATEVR